MASNLYRAEAARAAQAVGILPRPMLQIDDQTLREGLERAADLLKLQRLSSHDDAEQLAAAVYANFGIDDDGRTELVEALIGMLPVSGDPIAEALIASSMSAGVLVGLVIAGAAVDADPDAMPDFVPTDF